MTTSVWTGTFSPGRRTGCPNDNNRVQLACTLGQLSPRFPANDKQLDAHKELHVQGEGAARNKRAWLSRCLPLLGIYWPVPVTATTFLLAVKVLGYTARRQVLPGAQAVVVMSLLQCCWAVMTYQGQRHLLRLAQLAATLLGVLMLLPRRDMYGARIWASAFDDDGGVIVPGVAASLATLFGLMDSSADQRGLGRQEDANFSAVLLRLEAALAAVVMLWMLQIVAAIYGCAAAANSSSNQVAGQIAGHHAVTVWKSHTDLPTLEALEVLAPASDLKLWSDARPITTSPESGHDAPRHPLSVSAAGCSQRGVPRHLGHSGTTPLQLGKTGTVTLPSVLQHVLLFGACVAQCVAGTLIVATGDSFAAAERLRADEDGTAPTAAAATSAGGGARSQDPSPLAPPQSSWTALALLAGAMAATLPLPALLRSRCLLHTALRARPTASRALGLLLLDVNAAKLLLAVAVGVLGDWRVGILTWQLLQVVTMVLGVAKLYASGLRAQAQLLAAGAATVAPAPDTAAAAPRLTVMLPVGGETGCEDADGVCGGVVGECEAARGAVASPGFCEAVGRAPVALQERRGGLRVAVPEVSPAALAPAGSPDVTCAATASLTATGTSGGCSSCRSSDTLRSASSSGNSLASAAEDEPHTGLPGAGCGAAAAVLLPLAATAAHLARRSPPSMLLGNSCHAPLPSTCMQHHSALPASAAAAGHHGASARRLVAVGRQASSGAATRFCGLAAAAHPWSFLRGSLSCLACTLWVMLMAPPLALLGEEPSDFFEGLVDTGPGAAATLALVTGMAAALTVSGICLMVCIATGEFKKRWQLNPVEARRLECLAWACGPPLAVAAFSAASWALGDELNAAAYAAAEMLRCAALWPLVWLQEPWLLGGVDWPLGGCGQHAGCGITCVVLRWCGLRPGSGGAGVGLGGRCDERAREAPAGAQQEQQVTRLGSRRGRGIVHVEVN